jgi:predicted GNAT family N-acyltransferase
MPIADDFDIEVCAWTDPTDRSALLSVRDAVFGREQQVPEELERDVDDARSQHVLARSLEGTPIATGRVAPGGVIGRMAVVRDWRRRGVGTMVLRRLLDLARAGPHKVVTLHAQRHAVPFYQRHGFTIDGGEFEEAGIAHVSMRRELVPFATPRRATPPPSPEPIPLRADTAGELVAATRGLLSRAHHGLCILERELRAPLLHDAGCLAQLRRLATSGRRASIRIIAQDLTRALEDDPRLVVLAQRLPSVITLRRPVEREDVEYPSAFACNDTRGYLFRPLEHVAYTTGCTYAPGRHAQLLQIFDAVWARSETWDEPRALDI